MEKLEFGIDRQFSLSWTTNWITSREFHNHELYSAPIWAVTFTCVFTGEGKEEVVNNSMIFMR